MNKKPEALIPMSMAPAIPALGYHSVAEANKLHQNYDSLEREAKPVGLTQYSDLTQSEHRLDLKGDAQPFFQVSIEER